MKKYSQIIVTGCAGFIGSHMVDLLLKNGHKIIGVDCFTYAGNQKNIAHHQENPDFKFHNVDICQTEYIKNLCLKHDVKCIINFAAETHVDNSIASCDNFIHSNINGVKSLLEVSKDLGIELLHISTDEVYGSTIEGSFSEGDVLNPQNPYSATKAAAEHLVRAYSNTYNTSYKMVRMSNNFGPRQHPEKFIPTIIRSLKEQKRIPVYGDGKNVRDWLYVKDCVTCINAVLIKGEHNQIYNITYNDEKENLEIVEIICDNLKLDHDKWIEFVADRPGHDFRYSIDNQKIKSLGIGKPTPFDIAIKETIKHIV